jgi:uncharacterized protein YecE (DUF72 family)
LAYVSKYIDAIEINSTFYRIPSEKSSQKWVQEVAENKSLKFSVKLWQKFTHEQILAPLDEIDAFKRGIAPLADSGRMAALLIQFPWRFKNNQENRLYVQELLLYFGEYPCAVEFRHGSWDDEQARALLAEHRASFVNIDQPVIGDSLQQTDYVTAPVSCVRLHGRNYKNWFNDSAGRNDRYNYLYTEDELRQWSVHVQDMATKAQSTFVIFNNHFRGQAFVNSLQMLFEIKGQKIPAPPVLLRSFPDLRDICIADQPEQKELF